MKSVISYDRPLFDADGNVTNITSSTAQGTSISYQYDLLNRLTNVVDAALTGTQYTAYGYDRVGNLQRIQYPCGVTNQYQYDSINHLTNLLWNLNASQIASFYYQLGAAGNRTNLSESLNGTVRAYAWSYDRLYRLTNETVSGASPTGTLGYGLDPVGNRTNRTAGLGLSAQNFTYNSDDWISTDVYDSDGNTRTNSSNQPYFYDFEDRLTNFNIGQVLITYNADGQRISKIVGGVTTLYLVDAHNPSGYAQVCEELTVSGGVTNLAKAYTYGLSLISQRQPGVATNFYTADGHGNVRLLLNLAGSTTDTYAYDAYGNLIDSTGTTANNYLYCGEQWDADLGVYYLRARYYVADHGRFNARDASEGSTSEPISLHKYLYTSDNPSNREDPTGQDDSDVLTDFCTPVVGWWRLVSGTTETDFTPNWRKAVGPVKHTFTSVQIGFPRTSGSALQIASQMFTDLKDFAHFNQPNSIARVQGSRVFFETFGKLGVMSDRFNPGAVAVEVVNGPGQYEITGMTLGHHMLVGIRRWRIVIVSPQSRILRMETEAYEQSNGQVNRFGYWTFGQSAQKRFGKTILEMLLGTGLEKEQVPAP